MSDNGDNDPYFKEKVTFTQHLWECLLNYNVLNSVLVTAKIDSTLLQLIKVLSNRNAISIEGVSIVKRIY